jgi:hypothetical protein
MSEIEAGDGWRLIDKEKDTPREGDEFWSVMLQEWGPLWQGEAFLTGYTYRRRIPAKPEPLELKDSNGELDASAGPKDCSLMQDGRGELPEVIVLSGIDDIRKLGEWLISVAEWREAQDAAK